MTREDQKDLEKQLKESNSLYYYKVQEKEQRAQKIKKEQRAQKIKK